MIYTSQDYRYLLDEYGNAVILEYTGDEEYVSIDRIDGHPVTVIKDFGWSKNVKEIHLPETLIMIEDAAFREFRSLVRIDLPDSLKIINGNPFWGCNHLREIHLSPEHLFFRVENGALISKEDQRLIYVALRDQTKIYHVPEGVKNLMYSPVGNCKSLEEIVLPGSVINIKDSAFWGCRSLVRINLPESLISIGECAFYDCMSLKEIRMPDSVISLGKDAFSYCSSLEYINIPDQLIKIDGNPFCGCEALKEISISPEHSVFCIQNDSLISKEDNRLVYCLPGEDTETYSVPYGIEIIGENAFAEHKSLKNIELPEKLISIENNAFSGCRSLEAINLPESLIEIGNMAFYCCEELKNVHLPESLKMIGEWAFYGCRSLTEINIPESLEFIGEEAFGQCSRLKEIKLSKDHWIYDKITL